MSKKFRDFLFYFFVAVFIFGTLILSLYASGYKFNLRWPLNFNRILVKTGMLALDSSPKNAYIYINNELEPSSSWKPWSKKYLSTPAKIKNLLPGEYELSLKKEGYFPFQRKINIYSGQTTFLEDITLFKSSDPNITAIIDNDDNGKISLSPDNKYLYLENINKIINISSGTEKLIDENLKEFGNWLESNKLLISGILISPSDKQEDEDFRSLIGVDAYDWKIDEKTNRLYYKNNSSISYLDLNQKTGSIAITDKTIVDYLPINDYLFAISKDGSKISLKTYSTKTWDTENSISLPNNSSYILEKINDKYISLYDNQNKTIYFLSIDEILKRNIYTLNSIDKVNDWSFSRNNIVYYINDWEILSLDLTSNKSNLLTRLGEPLKEIKSNINEDYIVFSSDKKIGVFDLKTGFITIILEAEKIGSIDLDEKDNLIYFWGKINGQSGIYSIPIK